MNVSYKKLEEIIPYKFNNKDHWDEVDVISNSIQECGFRAPIIIDENNVIIVGHGRLLWAKKAGLKEVLTIQYTDMTEKQKRKYRLYDNKTSDLSKYNKDNVKYELERIDDPLLKDLFKDLDLTFDEGNLDLENQDIAPVPQANKPVVEMWDLFQLWNHFLLCWDATEIESYSKLVQDKEIDMVFTDPPYNINYKWSGKKTSNTIKNDHMDSNQFSEFLKDSFKCLNANTKSNSPRYVFHSHKTQKTFEQALNDNNIKVISQLIRNKPSVNHVGWDYKQKHEPFFYCSTDWRPKFFGDVYDATVLDFNSDKSDEQLLREIKKFREAEKVGKTTIRSMNRHNVQDYDHPTQKPVDLVAYAIQKSSRLLETVIDPFWGSGTTLIACEREQRICYTMELDPKYVEVIIKRYSDFTKHKKAIKCLNRKLDIRKILNNV